MTTQDAKSFYDIACELAAQGNPASIAFVRKREDIPEGVTGETTLQRACRKARERLDSYAPIDKEIEAGMGQCEGDAEKTRQNESQTPYLPNENDYVDGIGIVRESYDPEIPDDCPF